MPDRGEEAAPEVNEYEARRQATIAANKALLQSLALDSAALALSSRPKKAAVPPSARKKKPAPVKRNLDNVPRRVSSRLAGLQADSEVAKRKAEDLAEAVRQADRAKRQRIKGDLELSDVLVTGKMWDGGKNFFGDAPPRWDKGKYEKTFTEEDIEATGDKALRAVRERMSCLSLFSDFTPHRRSSSVATGACTKSLSAN
jgi:hypothetical protein